MAINPKLLNEGEHVVWSTRTHAKALLFPALVLIVAAGVGGYLSSLPDSHRKIWLTLIWVVAGVVIAVYSLWPFLRWFTTTYTVTNRRLTTHSGVISRTGHDIPLARISDVSYEKGLLDRLLGCGTLVVSDASEQGRVALHDVPRVEKLQLQLSDLLFHGDRQDAQHDDGT
ncbi:MAG: PH domain-containing protein [Propionibacteriales bacterium]|nr:PH domain-containing protein [Propionibacteriales bacterium]